MWMFGGNYDEYSCHRKFDVIKAASHFVGKVIIIWSINSLQVTIYDDSVMLCISYCGVLLEH